MPKRVSAPISDALKRHMQQSGKADREIAREAGIDHSIIGRFRRGESMLGLEVIDKIAGALDLRLVHNSEIKRKGAE